MTAPDLDSLLFNLREIAASHNGQCLALEAPLRKKDKVPFRCAQGHTWEGLPQSILRGHWCRICGNTRQGKSKLFPLKVLKDIASERGGKCLSETSKTRSEKMLWECQHGHRWEAVAASIRSGTWCPICAGRLPKNDALADLKALAEGNGGKCLSTTYLGARAHHMFQCAHGHEWPAVAHSIRRGTWCPHCAGTVRLSVAELQKTAKERGGELLSDAYYGGDKKLHWRCADGHEWLARPSNIRTGVWCPSCALGNTERICADIFAQLSARQFVKARPRWLKNERGEQMELDGYCEELKLAFEYHGEQHYRFTPFFHKTRTDLEQRQLDDALKESLCDVHGVKLIIVPYTVSVTDMPSFVFAELARLRPSLPLRSPDSVAVAKHVLPQRLRLAKALASEHGGECLSTAYINNSSPLAWRCHLGHEWSASTGSVHAGSWCPICAGKLPPAEALKELQRIAATKGGRCLAEEYIHGKYKLKWECAEGHMWDAAANGVRGGSWCPTCSHKDKGPKKLGLQACIDAAEGRGGVCLSSEYINSDTKLKWRCDKGHEWEAIPYSVVTLKTWCKRCSHALSWQRRREKPIEGKRS